MRLLILTAAAILPLSAQAPKQFLDAWAPKATTKVVTIQYVNSFDGSAGEAMLELPPKLDSPVPLIITPHAANWTQEMNRSCWSGIAEEFGVMILYPRHQGKTNPRVSFASPKQMGNLESALAAVQKSYPVDKKRIYSAGISQGAVETLVLAGRNPELFAAAMSINPVADLFAFYSDLSGFLAKPHENPDPLTKLRMGQWKALVMLMEVDFGGTPDAARPDYYVRNPATYAPSLAKVPLTIYWADDDELIPNGSNHQGGMLANLIRLYQPKSLNELKHSNGHGYPFYRVDLSNFSVKVFPRDKFVGSVKEMLGNSRVQ